MLKKLRHIGIMSEDLEGAIQKFKGFGLPCTQVIESKEMGLQVAFLRLGETFLEFIHHTEPDRGNDPLISLVRGQRGIINHLCFEVDDLDSTIRDFEKAGARLVEGCPRPGAHGRMAFFYPDTTEGILIELCEIK